MAFAVLLTMKQMLLFQPSPLASPGPGDPVCHSCTLGFCSHVTLCLEQVLWLQRHPDAHLLSPLLEPSREQGSERLVFLHLTVWNSLPGSQLCWRFHVPLRASVIPQHWLLQGATELRCSEPGRRPAGNVSVM